MKHVVFFQHGLQFADFFSGHPFATGWPIDTFGTIPKGVTVRTMLVVRVAGRGGMFDGPLEGTLSIVAEVACPQWTMHRLYMPAQKNFP